MDYQSALKQFVPEKDFFIGIDSDGCVFDSMEVKQKEFELLKSREEIRGSASKLPDISCLKKWVDSEWKEHDLIKYIKLVDGQEHGTKSEHLAKTAKGKYPDNRILMIGDAIGDMEAAKNNNAPQIAIGSKNSRCKKIHLEFSPAKWR